MVKKTATAKTIERQERYKKARASDNSGLDWEKIGQELRGLRTMHPGISAEALAKRFDTVKNYIYKLEAGEINFLRSACGIRYAYLMRCMRKDAFEKCTETKKMLEMIEHAE